METRTKAALLARRWVEIAEEGGPGRVVLRPLDAPDVPPARAGRRRLDLRGRGAAEVAAPGPADAMTPRPGAWSLSDEGVLAIDAPGWSGTYALVALDAARLVLAPRGDGDGTGRAR